MSEVSLTDLYDEEEQLDDILCEISGAICSEDDDATDSVLAKFLDKSVLIESSTVTYKETALGLQPMVTHSADQPEPNLCQRQLLQSKGGITLPEEITLSILGFLKADDQIRSLTAFQQCSKSCYDLAYPFIWGDEHVVSMRGINIIRQSWDPCLTGIVYPPTAGLIRLWSSLSRVKKMRIVEIGPLHMADTTANVLPPFERGVKLSIGFPSLTPYGRLEEVKVTESVSTQILDQGKVQATCLQCVRPQSRV